MNRKFKRKAEKEGVPHTVTFPNLVTGLDFMESVGKLTREALDRFKKTLTEK